MTEAEVLAKLRELSVGDKEANHYEAHEVIADLLPLDVRTVWLALTKEWWYA